MKIRNGFVSNSSSSSFIIYGAYFDKDELLEIIKPTLTEEQIENIENECMSEYWQPENLQILEDYDQEQIYIGRSWAEIKDDETGKQFKDNIKLEIDKIIGQSVDCKTIEKL